jgi:hypothetical protein
MQMFNELAGFRDAANVAAPKEPTIEKIAKKAIDVKNVISKHSDQQNYNLYKHFASAENLAHYLAYELEEIEVGQEICVLDNDGEINKYIVAKLNTTHPGFVGYILTSKEPENNKMHVIFRGAVDRVSFVRNLEKGCPGNESFNSDKVAISEQILTAVAQQSASIGKRINVTISGHGLGAADTQNYAAYLIDLINQKYMNTNINEVNQRQISRQQGLMLQLNPLLDVSDVNINILNFPGISKETSAKCEDDAKNLSMITEQAINKVNIRLTALKVDGDVLQQAGFRTLFARVNDPKIANIEVMKMKHRQSEGMLVTTADYVLSYMGVPSVVRRNFIGLFKLSKRAYSAHSLLHFDIKLLDEQFHYENNSGFYGAQYVEKELSNHIGVTQNLLFDMPRKFLHKGYHILCPVVALANARPQEPLIPAPAAPVAAVNDENEAILRIEAARKAAVDLKLAQDENERQLRIQHEAEVVRLTAEANEAAFRRNEVAEQQRLRDAAEARRFRS